MEYVILFFKTIALRPYVFVFLAAFLFSSICWLGRKRTLIFWFGTWILAFLSEFSSTRTGFPYGWYSYTGSTHGQELFISNVPFMDSLSYSFLLFASFNMALFCVAPLKVEKRNIEILDTFSWRQSFRVLFLTSLFMMMIDVVIDPVAFQGEKWFLGKIYTYKEHGHYFNIPLSNAGGWFLVGFLSTKLFQTIEKKFLGPNFKDKGICRFPFSTMLGVGLYYGVLLFNMAVTAYIQDWPLLIADTFIFLTPTTLLILRVLENRDGAPTPRKHG